jgi:outer membrane receptor for ferrienterochelin and colicins
MSYRWYWLFSMVLVFGFIGNASYAQDYSCGNISIDSAEQRYDLGRFEECMDGLNKCLQVKKAFNADQKIQAYHILAKCYLAVDSISGADSVIEELLLLKDNFETDPKDPDRFISRVAFIRSSIISSVSKRNEDMRLAPATTAVITAEEILQRGYTDLIDVLKDLPGFDISVYYGQLYANVYQRGLRTNNTDKTLLLVDGVEENDLWSNFADISQQYPVTNIKRIEVIYGPASTMYGPTAFSGVINIITKEPADYLKSKASFGINANTGISAYDTRYVDISSAYKKGAFSFNVTGRFYHSDRPDLSSQSLWDYDPNDYEDSIPLYGYRNLLSIGSNAKEYLIDNGLPSRSPFYRVSSDTSRIVLTEAGAAEAVRLNQMLYDQHEGKFDYTAFNNSARSSYINARINIADFSLGFVSWNKNEGNGTTFTDYIASVSGSRWLTNHNYAYFKYSKRINEKLLFTSFINYRIHAIKNGSKITTKKEYSALGGLELKDLVNGIPASWQTTYYYEQSEQFRAEFKLLYKLGKNFYLNSGVELRNSQLQGYYLTSATSSVPQNDGTYPASPGGNQYNVNDIGVYSQGNYRTKNGIGFTLGARLDYNQIRRDAGLGYHLSPRFVIDYALKEWVFKAIVSHGIENVSNYTKFDDVNIAPNPALKAETIYNYEFSASKKISDLFMADIDFYYSSIRNVVSAVVLNRVLQNQNIGEFKIKGIQSNFYYKSPGKKWQASLNYTFTDPLQTKSVDSADNVVDIDLRVPDIAAHKLNAVINCIFLKNFNINFRGNYLSAKKNGLNTTAPANKLSFPGYFVGNATLSVQNYIKGATLQLGCNNIFNNTYFSPGIRTAGGVRVPNAILQIGRNFFLKINYEL